MLGLSCGMQYLQSSLLHVRSTSLTRDQNQPLALGAQVLVTGLTREDPHICIFPLYMKELILRSLNNFFQSS